MPQLNLRNILAGDNIASVVEKINYNFQQIALNGGGPQGIQGLIGAPGIPGPEGPTGLQGPTGSTGTYLFAGVTAPNSLTSLDPSPRYSDLYIQADSINSQLSVWFKGTTGATGWSLVNSINTSDGIFTVAESFFSPGDPSVTAAYPRLSAASLFIISDYESLTAENQILSTDGASKKISSWLDYNTSIQWQSLFGGTKNQIRLLNTDPQITGFGANDDRANYGAGMILSLRTLDGEIGSTATQILSIETLDDVPLFGNKYFYLSANQGTTASILTDTFNRVAVYAPKDVSDPINSSLTDSLTVFGTELIHDSFSSTLRVDTGTDISAFSRIFMSKGSFSTGLTAEWEFRLGNSSDSADHSLKLFGSESGRSSKTLEIGISTLDERSGYHPQLSIGGDNPIAELEIGKYVAGRLGIGQIYPTSTNNYAAGYNSMNAFRGPTGSWTLRGDASHNGSFINWSSSDGKISSFLLLPSTGGSDRIYSDDAFLSSQSSITMKRASDTGAMKLFIDSYGYTAVDKAPHIVIGLEDSSPASFNFGNTAEGIGLHGSQKSIEWISSQIGASAVGFRFSSATVSVGGNTLTVHKHQHRSYDDTTWKDAISVISQNNNSGGTHSGNVIIGNVIPSSTIGKSKLTVVGATSPVGGTAAPYLGSPQIVDFQTAGGTSAFTLDRDGNVVSGIRFGNAYYDSSDEFTLDYYEEGTWTPSLNTSTTVAGWDSTKYKIFKSNYTRIGDRVKVDFTIKIDGLASTIGSTASMYISGFPFRPDFERVSGTGATVGDPLNPGYPLVPLKGMGIDDGGGSQVGEVVAFAGAASAIPTGWLLCNGQSVSRTVYSALFSKIGTTYGTNDSLTFKLPDLRGYFVRGLNEDNSSQPDYIRSLGSTQSDSFASHSHNITYKQGASDDNEPGISLSYMRNSAATGGTDRGFQNQSTGLTGGGETRPVNMAMNYMIYAGNEKSIADLSGGFVLFGGTNTRLYLYDSISTLDLSSIPGGSGISSSLFGSFEYFISNFKSTPIVSGSSFNFTIGSSSFSISLLPLISSETTLTSVSVSGLPGWMRFDDFSNTIEFNTGVTEIPGPTSSYSFTVTASNSVGSASGTVTANTFSIAPPVVSTTTPSPSHTVGTTSTVLFTSTNSPTYWSVSPSANIGITGNTAGATLTIGATFNTNGATVTVSATNASGTGSTIIDLVVSEPVVSSVGFSYINNWAGGTEPSGGGYNLDIYDSSSGGTILGQLTNNFLSIPPSSFNMSSNLVDGQTYYVEANVGWGFYGYTFDTSSSVIYDSSVPLTTRAIDTGSGSSYSTGSRLPFTYNSSSEPTIVMDLVSY